jgi:small subunit ribosomal protein S1
MKDTEDFEALLKEFEQAHADAPDQAGAKVGDRVKGRVVSIGEEQVFVDLGGKSEGIMEVAALTDADGNLTVAVGDTVEASVTSIDEEAGTLLLGSQHGRHLHGLDELEQAYRQQLPVEGRVTGAIKGGVEVQIAGQRAFCPASQVDIRFVEDLSEFVGQHLSFRVTKLEGGRRPNLVVSRRMLLEEEQQALAAETRARIEEGVVLKGTVTSIKDYGAFVDLGGIEGMVHVSELAYGHVKHPSEILREGQPVEVQVLRVEQTDNPKRPEKISLSIRALASDPWRDAADRLPVGSRVRGTVTRLQTFGAFVEIEPGLEGLVHVSELGAGRRVGHPQEVLTSGQEVEATVLGVDPDKRRISLSLDASKQAADAPEAKSYADYDRPKEGFGTLGDLLRESMRKQKK